MAREVTARGNICGKLIPSRYILTILGSMAMGIIYGLKVNLHVALVGMLNHTAIKISEAKVKHTRTILPRMFPRSAPANVTETEDGPFSWEKDTQGLLLSSYFWGYIVAQLPGGRLAEMFSAKWVMFFSVSINIVATLLIPVMAGLNASAVIVMRILQGIGGGVTFPAMHVMLSRWAPPAERGLMSSIVYAGTALGTVLSMLLAGILAKKVSWESVFYIMGGASIIWCIVWGVFIADSPKSQRFISADEREMIMKSLGSDLEGAKLSVPWKKVISSLPFLAILIAHTCNNWGFYLLLIELPTYMKQVLHYEISENSFFSSLPFFTMWLFSILLSKGLDVLKRKGSINTTVARKIATIIASLIPGSILLSLCFVTNRSASVALMTIAVTAIGAMFAGLLGNHIDIAPNFAGTLMAITNTLATIPGILVPIFVSWVTKKEEIPETAWKIIFFTGIGTYTVMVVVYTLFGSGEQQSWNNPPRPSTTSTIQ